MARSTNTSVGKHNYFRISRTIGHKINDKGKEVPVVRQFYGKTKKEAEAKYQAFLDKQSQGLESKKQYFGVLADNWIHEFFAHDGSLKDSTRARYIATWNRYMKPQPFYGYPLEQVTAKTLQQAYNQLKADGVPVSQIKTINKLLRRLFRYIELEGLGRNVTGSLTIPKEKVNAADEETIRVWSEEEIKKIFTAFEKADNRFRLRFLLVLAYYTGCRKGELLALTYDDITPDGVRITKALSDISDGIVDGKVITHKGITDPKSKRSVRTVPVAPKVLDELQRHKKWHKRDMLKHGYRTEYIFTTDSGEFYDSANLDRALRRFYKKAGVEFKPMHTYRHTYASTLCSSGVPIQTASALLGHESIETTARFYVNVDEESKQEAAMKLATVLEG